MQICGEPTEENDEAPPQQQDEADDELDNDSVAPACQEGAREGVESGTWWSCLVGGSVVCAGRLEFGPSEKSLRG